MAPGLHEVPDPALASVRGALFGTSAATTNQRRHIVNHQRAVAQGPIHQLAVLGIALLSLLTSGCLYAGGSKRIEFEETDRILVKFSTALAAQDFHDGLRQSSREDYTEGGGFLVPFLIARGGAVYHETAHYNAEVRLADVNRDSDITETEAQAYLAFVRREAAGN